MADLELDEQVREVIGLMLRNEWEASLVLELARKWGVSVSVVWRRSSEASRFIRLCHGSEDELRDALLRNITRIGGKAEDGGDFRNALGAQELSARVHGLIDQKRERDDRATITHDELAELLRGHGYEVQKHGERKPAIAAGQAPED